MYEKYKIFLFLISVVLCMNVSVFAESNIDLDYIKSLPNSTTAIIGGVGTNVSVFAESNIDLDYIRSLPNSTTAIIGGVVTDEEAGKVILEMPVYELPDGTRVATNNPISSYSASNDYARVELTLSYVDSNKFIMSCLVYTDGAHVDSVTGTLTVIQSGSGPNSLAFGFFAISNGFSQIQTFYYTGWQYVYAHNIVGVYKGYVTMLPDVGNPK